MSQPTPTLALKKPTYKNLDQLTLPVTALFKGASGTGKTFTACHFPKPVLLSFDNNIDGLLSLPSELQKELKIINVTVDGNGKKIAEAFTEGDATAFDSIDTEISQNEDAKGNELLKRFLSDVRKGLTEGGAA